MSDPFLVVQHPELGHWEVELNKLPLTIGRHDDNRMVLRDLSISNYHAKIDKDDGRYVLFDLDSTNGCILNGDPVREANLESTDRIELGQAIIGFYMNRSDVGSNKDQTWAFKLTESEPIATSLQSVSNELLSYRPTTATPTKDDYRSSLGFLYELGFIFEKSTSRDELIDGFGTLLSKAFGPHHIYFFLPDDTGKGLGEAIPVIGSKPTGDVREMAKRAVEEQVGFLIPPSGSTFSGALIAPLVMNDQIGGVVVLSSPKGTRPYDKGDLRLLLLLTSQAACFILTMQRFEATLRKGVIKRAGGMKGMDSKATAERELAAAPIRSTAGALEDLAHQSPSPENMLERLDRFGTTLYNHLSSILMVGRPDADGMPPDRVDLPGLVNTVIERQEYALQREGITVNLKIIDTPSRVVVKGLLLESVIDTLLVDARRRSQDGDVLTLQIQTSDVKQTTYLRIEGGGRISSWEIETLNSALEESRVHLDDTARIQAISSAGLALQSMGGSLDLHVDPDMDINKGEKPIIILSLQIE